jgi:hypothetical protein
VSTLLEEPSKRAPVPPEKDEPTRSIGIGVACTVLFHLLLVWLSPKFDFTQFSGSHSGIAVKNQSREQTFDFNLQAPEQPEKKQPQRFVETNTAAPENRPDKTNNFSSRDQQAAQEKPAEEIDPEGLPSVKGQDEIKNDSAIVSGDMAPPQLGAPPSPETGEEKEDQRDQEAQDARAELMPLAGEEKIRGDSPDGIASNISKSPNASTDAERMQEGSRDSKSPTGGLIAMPETKRTPSANRPRLASASLNRSSILTNKISGTSNMGVQASDAFRSEYGEYLNELIEIIQVQWDYILRESSVYPQRGTQVAVKFKINSGGEIEILNVEETAGKQGTFSCLNAIQARQPYRKWSDQMIALLGTSQELVFTFHYL